MKMKHTVVSALLALGMSTSCVESTPALQIGGAAAQGEDCTIDSEGGPGLLRGSLDMGFRPFSGYPLVLGVTSNLAETVIEVGDEPVSGDEDLNTIYLTDMVLSYSSPTEGLTFTEPSATVPIYGTLQEDGDLLLNLLTSEAIQDLLTFVSGGGSAEVLIDVRLRGKRASGDEVESNEITFPLAVYRSDLGALQEAVCGTVQVFEAPTEPCDQRGLNGNVPACTDPPPPPQAP